jgi:chromate reductase
MTSPARRILAVCGSLQAESSNLRLLTRATQLELPDVQMVLTDQLRHLPHFNPDLLGERVPPAVAAWQAALAGCAAVLVASPEYGHSLPGALKNGIDWVIGSGELHQKVVAITAAVRHPERGTRGLAALRQTLLAVDARVVWDEPIVLTGDVDGTLRRLLEALLTATG